MFLNLLLALLAGAASLPGSAGAGNCGANPSTIELKRGEKITIEYWNPGPVLQPEGPEASPLEDRQDQETRHDDDVTTRVDDRTGSWEAAPVTGLGDPDAASELPAGTGAEPAEPTTTLGGDDVREGSGFVGLRDGPSGGDEASIGELEAPLETTAETLTSEETLTTESAPSRAVQVLTNLMDPATAPSDDDTMELVIESESLHPVKAPVVLGEPLPPQQPPPPPPPTTEAVPVESVTEQQTPVGTIESQLDERQDGSGSGDAPLELRTKDDDVLLAVEPLLEQEEGSGSFDGQITHTFEHDTFAKQDVPETEQTTEQAVPVDDGQSEFRNDDILISRIRTIVNSLTNAKPLFRRTTGLFQSVFSRRSRRTAADKDFYRSPQFKQFLRSQPLPMRRALSPNFAGRFSRNMEDQTVLVDEECDLNIKTEPGLHLLMTFHNLSAPYTVDCAGAYVEIEREGNGFEARWCGNPIGQQRGMRSHVIFARSEVRVSVFNSPEIVRQKMADEIGKTTRGLDEPLPPAGFTADIEVIDLHDAGQYTAFQRSQAYSTVNRLVG